MYGVLCWIRTLLSCDICLYDCQTYKSASSIKEGLCIIIPKEKSKGVRANVLLFVCLMMMMAVSASAFYFDVTVLFVTVLAVIFKLKSCVNDSVFR